MVENIKDGNKNRWGILKMELKIGGEYKNEIKKWWRI